MPLLNAPVLQYVDQLGIPLAFAEAYFYGEGTTTPETVWQDGNRTITHASPVVADDAGYFPAIYLDPEVNYRMKLIAAGGDLVHPLMDIDPVGQVLSIGAADLENGAIEEKLGYTPVDPADAIFTAAPRLQYSPTPVTMNTDEVGFRVVPQNVKNANYTLVLQDASTGLVKDDTSTPQWTIPPHSDVPLPIGAWFECTNINTGAVSIHRGVAVDLRLSGVGTNADLSLAAWGTAHVTQVEQDKWIARGTGLS